MPNPRKLFLKALNNPNGLRFREFTALVEAFGFELRRISGSHHIFGRPDVQEIVNAQPTRDGKAEDYQVRQFPGLVERYGLSLKDPK
jgi:predicted RNA binding protein YcfA (HicA-like mRNA interferase family)